MHVLLAGKGPHGLHGMALKGSKQPLLGLGGRSRKLPALWGAILACLGRLGGWLAFSGGEQRLWGSSGYGLGLGFLLAPPPLLTPRAPQTSHPRGQGRGW